MAQRSALRPDINVTPLVDVVLVLLIIFMVVTPQMQKGPAIEMPGVANPDAKTPVAKEPISLKLSAKGELFLSDEPVLKEALIEHLAATHQQAPDRRMVIRADRSARYEDVRALFKLAHTVGFPGVSLEVGDKKRPAS